MASAAFEDLSKEILVEVLKQKSIEEKQEETMCITTQEPNWMDPIRKYLEEGVEPRDKEQARKIRINAPNYALKEGVLYRKGKSLPWLRCLDPKEAERAIKSVHAGLCGAHTAVRSTTQKLIRTGYFWPTLTKDVQRMVERCLPCQKHANITQRPQVTLTNITSPWPFHQWGIDIVGPFPLGGKFKFLIVAIDYFSKWVEAEPMAKITGPNTVKFVWKQIVCRYGIPHTIVSDNGSQFAYEPFRGWCEDLGIKQNFTSVAHPQSNGQTEVTNRTIVAGLKRRVKAAKGAWVEELPSVLWSYRTTPRTATKETPFSLVYGTEAVIPIEVALPTERITRFCPERS